MWFKKKKIKSGKCCKCGSDKELKNVMVYEYSIYPYKKVYDFVCIDCLKAIKIREEIEDKEREKSYKEEKEKNRKLWIKERDKILKENKK